jgi:hypothetical protein
VDRLHDWMKLLPQDNQTVTGPDIKWSNTAVVGWSNKFLNDALNPLAQYWTANHKGEAAVALGTLRNPKGVLAVKALADGTATCYVYLRR